MRLKQPRKWSVKPPFLYHMITSAVAASPKSDPSAQRDVAKFSWRIGEPGGGSISSSVNLAGLVNVYIAIENRPLIADFPIRYGYFPELCYVLYVSLPEGSVVWGLKVEPISQRRDLDIIAVKSDMICIQNWTYHRSWRIFVHQSIHSVGPQLHRLKHFET